MTSEPLFVWIYLPDSLEPVVAGRLDLATTAKGTVGQFVYGQSYLARSDAVSLDPVALPLRAGATLFTSLGGFPGVLLDACPDRWGIKIIDRLYGKRDYPVGYLLINDPGRSGALAFSFGAAIPPAEQSSREFSISDLLAAAAAVEGDQRVDSELLKALRPGTGGARPKCNIVDSDGVWLAKFQSIDDRAGISIPRLEHATMMLGRECGIETALTRCEVIDGHDVCFVKRFDRERVGNDVLRRGYVSARTVFFADPGFAKYGASSYGRFATWMTRYGCDGADCRQLFRRMVYNCAVRNSDDHDLNHGLVHVANSGYRLAEAFDVVPVLTPHSVHRHAMLIGDSASGTVSNLVSNANAFGLARDEALAIVYDLQKGVQANWRDVLYLAGLTEEEVRRVEPSFKALPEREIER